MTFEVNGSRLLQDLKDLAKIGNVGKGGSRLALSDEDMTTRRWLRDRMTEAGLVTSIDGIGNVFGYTPRADRHLLVGSHTDTVPMGGWLDGALGVMCALEIARAFMAAGQPGEVGVAIVSFADEEGTLASLLGSRLFAGAIRFEDVATATDPTGRILGEERKRVGLEGVEIARIDPKRHVGYLEIHIEQGPVLEADGTTIGIVTDIVGIGRCRVTFHGRADHAGTTPMNARADAAQALYGFATEFRNFMRREGGEGSVFNLGGARIEPGAFNVVADRAELLVEYRNASDAVIDRIEEAIATLSREAARDAGVSVTIEPAGRESPAAMSPSMIEQLARAAQRLQISARTMASGAGHDAMSLASLVPSGMLFIPSIDGRSHAPEEDSKPEDIVAGLRVLAEAVSGVLEDATKPQPTLKIVP
ncbi:N-carbamoyl-L-amino-acid hydrolase [Rhodoligotrophos appendicifer]|uniref:M20 family metallo-hydrolase n=1 Tax=Rhodoligotrophos appendicifer TaxID=987056 RepID=UPI00117E8ADD|nr:M20 family metallo-hydrolase [Rhodoligotrophos appendicifer]